MLRKYLESTRHLKLQYHDVRHVEQYNLGMKDRVKAFRIDYIVDHLSVQQANLKTYASRWFHLHIAVASGDQVQQWIVREFQQR